MLLLFLMEQQRLDLHISAKYPKLDKIIQTMDCRDRTLRKLRILIHNRGDTK